MKDASSLRILAQSAHGCVQRCGCCEKLCLQFHRVIVPLTCERLAELQRYLVTMRMPEGAETGTIQLRFSEIVLLFSWPEIEEMRQLLAEAELALAREHLQRSFEAPSAEVPFSDAELFDL